MGRECEIEVYTAKIGVIDATARPLHLYLLEYKYQCFTFLIHQHDDCKNKVFWPSIFHLN